jgi:hypothetical protein
MTISHQAGCVAIALRLEHDAVVGDEHRTAVDQREREAALAAARRALIPKRAA